jgi:hypothetical protein
MTRPNHRIRRPHCGNVLRYDSADTTESTDKSDHTSSRLLDIERLASDVSMHVMANADTLGVSAYSRAIITIYHALADETKVCVCARTCARATTESASVCDQEASAKRQPRRLDIRGNGHRSTVFGRTRTVYNIHYVLHPLFGSLLNGMMCEVQLHKMPPSNEPYIHGRSPTHLH